MQPSIFSTFYWASFADPALIGEPPSVINPSSQPPLLALLRDNLALLPQLSNPVLVSVPLFFSYLPNFLGHAGFPTQPIKHLISLIVFLNKEKLRIQMINDYPSEYWDTLAEPSDAWECFLRLFSQIQAMENEIHFRQLVLPGVRSKLSFLFVCDSLNRKSIVVKLLSQNFLARPLTKVLLFKNSLPRWFSGHQASYQGRVEALLQAMLSSAGHLV